LKESITILIVDDDKINNMYLKSLANEQNWDTECAFDGVEAIEKFNNRVFDIILMDGKMPRMDGLKAIRTIRNIEKEKGIHTPIMAITGFSSLMDKSQFIESGADDIITKPIDEEDLFRKIKVLLA